MDIVFTVLAWIPVVLLVLAWIPVVLLVLVIFGRYVWPYIARGIIKAAEKKGNICDVCKGSMTEVSEHMRILSVRFDEKHDCSASYYIHSTTPVEDLSQVPAGSRACKIYLLQCQACGIKEVAVLDILPVRGQEILKNADVFPYEEFRGFYETDRGASNRVQSDTLDAGNESRSGIYFPR